MRLFVFLAAVGLSAQDIAKLEFLAGCWAGANGPEQFEEMWMKPRAGATFGVARTIVNGKTVFFETHVIAEREGKLVLNVRLKTGPSTTPFTLIKATGEEAVFENPQHDFPQRIIYRKMAGGLLGRIEGKEKGAEKATDYPMKPADCR